MYEEALGLEALVRALQRRYPDVAVLADISEQTRSTMKIVVERFLRMLEGKLSLPLCLKIIGYLRRVGGFSEGRLRAQFLRSRDISLTRQLASMPPDESPYEFITRYLDFTRQHIFEILHQYRAIFLPSDKKLFRTSTIPNTASSSNSSVDNKKGERKQYADGDDDDNDDDGGDLVAYWVNGHVLEIQATLKRYCGLSLLRVGVDFRAAMGSILVDRIVQIFQEQLHSGSKALLQSLKEHNWYYTKQELKKLGLVAEGGGGGGGEGGIKAMTGQGPSDDSKEEDEEDDESRVAKIVCFPPLACLSNSIIVAFNSLRHCTPIQTKSRIGRLVGIRLNDALSELSDAAQAPSLYSHDDDQSILDDDDGGDNGDQNVQTDKARSKKKKRGGVKGGGVSSGGVMVKMLETFETCLLPYLHGQLRRLFIGNRRSISQQQQQQQKESKDAQKQSNVKNHPSSNEGAFGPNMAHIDDAIEGAAQLLSVREKPTHSIFLWMGCLTAQNLCATMIDLAA
eukprot:jgi/Bigna1/128405/aug1.6_g3113